MLSCVTDDKINSMTKEEMLSKVSDTLGSETEEYNKVLSRYV